MNALVRCRSRAFTRACEVARGRAFTRAHAVKSGLLLCAALAAGCNRSEPEEPVSTGVVAPRAQSRVVRRGGFPRAPAAAFTVPRTSVVPIYDVSIQDQDLRSLEATAYSNETYPVTFRVGDALFEGARIRHRGAWARGWPKKPVKIFFQKEHRFESQRCVNLNSAWRDPAFIREAVAYSIYAACGVPASETRLVRLDVNGQFWGLYVQVEQPDQTFLDRQKLPGSAVYKANSRWNQADERDHHDLNAYARHYEKETRKKESHGDLHEFCHALATTPDPQDFFARWVDLDKYINYLAATALTQNWDGYNKNHFLVHDLDGSGKWFVVPWDLDRTLGDHWNQSFEEAELPLLLGTQTTPGVTGWNRLQDRFFSDPKLTARFLNRLQQLLDQEFTPDKLFPLIEKWGAQAKALEQDECRRWPRGDCDFQSGIDGIKNFIQRRRSFLAREIRGLQQQFRAEADGATGNP